MERRGGGEAWGSGVRVRQSTSIWRLPSVGVVAACATVVALLRCECISQFWPRGGQLMQSC